MNDPQPQLLRPEAQPVPWQQLTEHQKIGLKRLVLSLESALKKRRYDESAEADGVPPWLVQENFSKLIFVDGKRGTGKTSLLHTLVLLMSTGRSDSQYDGFDALGIAQKIRERVVVLEPLEMEPLPPDTPILSAILARLNSAAKRLGVTGRKQRGLLDSDINENRNYKRFVQLKAQIARALDSNLDDRKGSLDREQYGIEVINQEDDRLQLSNLLSESLHWLSEAIPVSQETGFSIKAGQHIFLVPIDDVDLNPDRCLELLRLLRHYSAPQLFFVLMGQFELAEQIVKLRISREYEQAGNPESVLSAVTARSLKSELAQVAVANLQKLVPNVVDLPTITLDKILGFRPLSVTGESIKSLGDLFSEIEFDVSTLKAGNLKELLDVGRKTGDHVVKKADKLRRGLYPGLGAFEVTPRRLVDLFQELSNALAGMFGDTRSPNQRVLDVFEDHWLRIIAEDPYLNNDQKKILREDGLQACEFTGFKDQGYDDYRILEHALATESGSSEYEPTLRVASGRTGCAIPGMILASHPDQPEIICGRTRCGLILINDMRVLLADRHASRRTDGRIKLKKLSGVAVAWVSGADVFWPVPPFETIAEHVEFDTRVRDRLRFSEESSGSLSSVEVEDFVRGYVQIGNQLLLQQQPDVDEPSPWGALVAQLNCLTSSHQVLPETAGEWMRGVLFLTLPEACGIRIATRKAGNVDGESGVDQDTVKRLERRFMSEKFELERLRGVQLAEIYEKGDTLWNRLNELSTKDSWVHLVAPEPETESTKRITTQVNRLEGEVENLKVEVTSNMGRLEAQMKQENLVKRFESSTRQTVSSFKANPETATVFVTELKELAKDLVSRGVEKESFASTALAQLQEAANSLNEANATMEAINLMKSGNELASSDALASRQQLKWFELGQSNYDTGRISDAEQCFEERLRICSLQTELRPESHDWQTRLGYSHGWLGDVYFKTGQLEKSDASHQAYLDVFRRLSEEDPSNTNWRRHLGFAHSRRGDVFSRTGRLEKAEASYQSCLEVFERLSEEDPTNKDWLRELGVSQSKLGNVYLRTGHLEKAQESYQEFFKHSRRLSKEDPTNKDWVRNLGVSHCKLGDVFARTRNYEEATASYQSYFETFKRLSEDDPTNKSWVRELGVAHCKLGDVYIAIDLLEQAGKSYQSYFETFKRLSEDDPANKDWLRELGIAHSKLGRVYLRNRLLDKAMDSYGRYFDIFQRLSEEDPANKDWFRNLGVAHSRLGDVFLMTDQVDDSEKSYRLFFDVFNKLSKQDPTNKDWLRDFGVAHSRLGEVSLRNNQREEARKHFRSAVEMLRESDSKGLILGRNRLELAIALGGYSQTVSGEEASKLQHEAHAIFEYERKQGSYFSSRADDAETELVFAMTWPSSTTKKKKASKKKATRKKKKSGKKKATKKKKSARKNTTAKKSTKRTVKKKTKKYLP